MTSLVKESSSTPAVLELACPALTFSRGTPGAIPKTVVSSFLFATPASSATQRQHPCSPETLRSRALSLNSRENFALPAPIDQGVSTVPLVFASRAWSLPAPPAPNHGGPSGRSITIQPELPCPESHVSVCQWNVFERKFLVLSAH